MSRVPIPRPARFTSCYGCGPDNGRGLALEFFREGDEVVADFTPAPEHGGYGVVLHGGVTATLVDEALGWAVYGLRDRVGLTTELGLTYLRSLRTGEPLRVRARIAAETEKSATVHVTVTDARGAEAARGVGEMRYVSLRIIERLGGFRASEAKDTKL